MRGVHWPAPAAGRSTGRGRRRLLPLLALTMTLAVGGCLDMTDYVWNVWLSNRSAQPFTVEVSGPAVAAPGRWVQAYRLPPHSTMAAAGTGKGTDIVVGLFRPDCELALTIPVQHGEGYASIDPTGAARVTEGLTETPSDAPQPRNPADMAIAEGCSPEWKAANPGFTVPPATLAAPSVGVPRSASAPAPSAAFSALGVSVANGLTVPVTIDVNGAPLGTVAAGATQDWDAAALPARPWAVEALSPSGRVLATLTVSATDYLSANSGRAALENLACGRLTLWAGAPVGGGPSFVPDPARPCD